ncbi:MAG: hypothetical protein DMG45_19385 [Acidobacteria bacterium]|nr:MAG: hypothetical protein DMG45_19385 [Acidobacteriota bacterium]
MLGQPQRRLVAAAAVVEGDEPSRKVAAGLDKLQVGLGNVLAKEEARAKRAGIIAADEEIDVTNVIGFENRRGASRTRLRLRTERADREAVSRRVIRRRSRPRLAPIPALASSGDVRDARSTGPALHRGALLWVAGFASFHMPAHESRRTSPGITEKELLYKTTTT